LSFEEKTWGILGSGVTNVAVYIQSIAKKAKIPSRGSLKDLTSKALKYLVTGPNNGLKPFQLQ
jgi:hypothetical protein